MSKPRAVPVPEAQEPERQWSKERQPSQQEPLSGSKKTKQHNHVSHHNPQG